MGASEEDPADLPANEVTLTAWVQASCQQSLGPSVEAEFVWFGADGHLGEAVDAGTVASWPLVGPPAEAPEERADVAVRSQFERASPPLRVTCAFVRRLATSVLRVRVRMPDPAAAAEREARPVTPRDAAGKGAGKGGAKEPAKPAADEVVIEVVVPLPPLLLARGEGFELTEDGLALVKCPGFEGLKVGVRCSGALLSDEIAMHLNPMLVTLDAVHRLPQELGPGQTRGRVHAVVDAFGQRRATAAHELNTRAGVRFQAHQVLFIGTWRQGELREYLQTARLVVDVHDRDIPPLPGASEQHDHAQVPTPPAAGKPETPRMTAAAAKGKGQAPAPSAGATDETSLGWASAAPPDGGAAHGSARFSLGELLNPRLKHGLTLRSGLEPVCGQRRNRRGGADGIRVSTLFGGGQELLASMDSVSYEVVPRYLEAGSFVTLSVSLARPLHPPVWSAEVGGTARGPVVLQGGTLTGSLLATLTGQPANAGLQDAGYERFARIVLNIDYRRTTLMKRLLSIIHNNNVTVMNLDSGQARALATVELTEEQRIDPDLDILTGFVVMDKFTRVVVIEGLLEGATRQVVELLGSVGAQRKCKFLFDPNLGFGQRLYAEFNLTLRHIKLRENNLEALTQRPDLCLQGRCDDEVAGGLNRLVEMKRTEHLHILKNTNAFPMAQTIVMIETQYGDYVADRELAGGCVAGAAGGDDRSCISRGTKLTNKTAANKQADAEEEESGDGDSAAEREAPVRSARLVMKAGLNMTNRPFARTLAERAAEPSPDILSLNRATVRELSDQTAAAAPPRKCGPRKRVDTSFLEGQPVHIYSGQRLNSAELQMRALRSEAMSQEGQKLLTYSEARNSGCFPMLEKEVPLDRMLRQSVDFEDSREPFRYPRQREASDYAKLPRDVSDARKDDLHTPWVENQFHSDMKHKKVVNGAFDARTLGTGGAHVIPLRRPGLPEPPESGAAEVTVSFGTDPPEGFDVRRHGAVAGAEPAPMRFSAKTLVGVESLAEKYGRTILDGDPKFAGINFAKRRVPPAIAAKYGKGKPVANVQAPVCLNSKEVYQEDIGIGTSDYLTSFMKEVSKPVDTRPAMQRDLLPTRRSPSTAAVPGSLRPSTCVGGTWRAARAKVQGPRATPPRSSEQPQPLSAR